MPRPKRKPHNSAVRTLIVDDQALYREGLREIMRHWNEFEVIGEADNGWNALTSCRKNRPDLVIMDNKMPTMSGVEAARRIVAELGETAVVMLSVSVEVEELLEAFDAGVRGYVLKETSSRQLRSYLTDVLHGEVVVSPSISKWLVNSLISNPARHPSRENPEAKDELDDGEREVVALVALGLSNEEIGAKLFISPGSVKKRLRAVMDKLGYSNRVQVAVYAVRNGIMVG